MGSCSRGPGTQGAPDTNFIRFLFARPGMPSQQGAHNGSVTKILSSLVWQGHFLLEEEKSHINYTSKLGPRPLELASLLCEGGEGEEVGFLCEKGAEPGDRRECVEFGLRPSISDVCMRCVWGSLQNVCLSKTDCKETEPRNLHDHVHAHSFIQHPFIKHLLSNTELGTEKGKTKEA